jgi:hypothetical protein
MFLKKCWVYSNVVNTNVFQVLTFRGILLTFKTLWPSIIGGVNLICYISWAVLIGSPGKWYDMQSTSPSKARIVVLISTIGIAFSHRLLENVLLS